MGYDFEMNFMDIFRGLARDVARIESLLYDIYDKKPKEKEKCWCEVNNQYLYRTNIGNILMSAKFCPECGRKLT